MRKWKKILAAVAVLAATTTAAFMPQQIITVEAEDASTGNESTTLVDLNTVWSYYDYETDPVTSGEDRTAWTKDGFDLSEWKTSTEGVKATFGAKKGAIGSADGYTPEILLTQYKEDGTDIEAFFFRTTINVSETAINDLAENAVVSGSVIYDDAALVYLNGELIAEFDNYQYENSSEKFTANMQYGGHNASTTTGTFEVAASKLKAGENIIAVELHQGRPTSSDIYFEMTSLELVTPEVISPSNYTQKAVSLTVGSDETSRNITWYADTEAAGTVQYAIKNGDEFPADYKEATATATATNDSGFYSNQATLPDLAYNTEYVYRLINGETVSETYSFKTSGESEFSFLLVGDPQIGASGNVPSDTEGWETTLNAAVTNFPDSAFLLSAGDQVNTANNETQYEGYLEHTTLKSLVTATVIGNHDSSSNAYSQHFNNPNESTNGATNAGSDYWFVYNNVLVMSLNSNNQSIAQHQEFMKEAIEANPDVDWKVVTFHHSIYSVASHALEESILQMRNASVPIFTGLDIDVVLMGHDHVYVRSYMMDGMNPVVTEEVESSVTNPDGILYVTVNSGSGSKFYNIQNAEFEYAAVKNQEKVPNFSNVEVTENSFKITTYRSNDLSVVDEFTIYREAETTKTVEADTKTTGFDNETAALELTKTAAYDSGVVNEDGGSAEIVQYNSDNQMYYVVNGTTGTLDIVPREVYTEENGAEGIKFNLKNKLINYRTDFVYGDMTSVAINTEKDLIAIAVQAAGTNENGLVVLMNYDNEIVAVIDAGVQPDMVTFTADGNKVLTANEGEPRDGYGEGTVDPQGSVTVADLSSGTDTVIVQNITFENWDASRDTLAAEGVIIKKNTAPSVDFEPEYIAVNSAGTRAYVALQEANAIATVDLTTNTVTAIKSMGFKDHNEEENALDMAKDDEIKIQTENIYGIYMPDGIAIYEVNGVEYLLTANEGDSREWGDYLNENEIKINGNKVVTFDSSDYDGLDADKTYLFGGRSFSIYNAETMKQVYDSGSDFETKTAEYLAEYFNCSNDKTSMDNRSGKKGPEAESVVVGTVGDKTYAFIGLERIGGVMVYDITDPANASYVNYINSRDFSDKIAGDDSPEGLCFVSAAQSLSKNAELIVANEVSGTVAIYEMTAKNVTTDDEQNKDNDDNINNNDNNQGTAGDQNNNGQGAANGSTNNESSDKKSESVQTGDTSNTVLWMVVMMLAMVVAGAAAAYKKRRFTNIR